MPVDRVLGVLQQVGAGRLREAVHVRGEGCEAVSIRNDGTRPGSVGCTNVAATRTGAVCRG
jgi:hypothetical protein